MIVHEYTPAKVVPTQQTWSQENRSQFNKPHKSASDATRHPETAGHGISISQEVEDWHHDKILSSFQDPFFPP
jgi:hypothetical protein